MHSAPASTTPPVVIDVPIEIKGDEITITQGDRRYRVRGLAKNLSSDILRVNLLAMRGDALHVDTLDMNVDRQKVLFSKRAAEELEVKEEVIRKDLGRVFLQLETLRNEQIRKALDPKEEEVDLSPEEKAAALELLKDPNLLQRILEGDPKDVHSLFMLESLAYEELNGAALGYAGAHAPGCASARACAAVRPECASTASRTRIARSPRRTASAAAARLRPDAPLMAVLGASARTASTASAPR